MEKTKTSEDLLRLDSPAERWLDAFPIGNGRIGAMMFGGPHSERLALNHENLWRGRTKKRTTQPLNRHLPEIREALLEGRYEEGAELAKKYLSGHERRVEPYQPLGDLSVDFDSTGTVADYCRQLDLSSAIARVDYSRGASKWVEEAFVSAEHNVLVVRFRTDAREGINATLTLDRIKDPDCTICPWQKRDRFGFEGAFTEGITFAAGARVAVSDGKVLVGEGASVTVRGASEVLLTLAMAVGPSGDEPRQWCEKHLQGIPMEFDTLSEIHRKEYRSFYERVRLNLPPDAGESLSLNRRRKSVSQDVNDPGLVALIFNYGRYLLLSSSRKCNQPANLQGLWNEELGPPWNSDIHCDINVQMNYWPAEPCDLPECIKPLEKFIFRCIPEAEKYARDLYGCRGVFYGIQTDIWGRPTPESPGWDVWTGAAAWLAQHLWSRFLYSGDRVFLREKVYPFYRRVAAFYEDYLIHDSNGYLVPVPSQSPENTFVGGGKPVSLCVGATMDILLIREVLENCLEAAVLLDRDREKRDEWENMLEELPPFRIGSQGQLLEWGEDFEETEPGHRHVSHLYGVYPGDQMLPDRLPQFYEAARVSLQHRLDHGGGHTGWSAAWTACLWARFAKGDKAYKTLHDWLTRWCTESLLDLHPPKIFQIDGNMGATAAVVEMLMQSYRGTIRLLPALPSQWSEGAVRGLVAEGGFVVDMEWEDSMMTRARITSRRGNHCRLVMENADWKITCQDAHIKFTSEGSGALSFATETGQTYEVVKASG